MAQSNVAREPSMDEILASIRKIIESNESVGPGMPANDIGASQATRNDRPYADDDIHLTIEDSFLEADNDSDENAAQDAGHDQHHFTHPVSRSVLQAPILPPLSLADVAARVRAASERQATPQRVESAVYTAAPRAAEPAREAPASVAQQDDIHAYGQPAASAFVAPDIAHKEVSTDASSRVAPDVNALPAQQQDRRTDEVDHSRKVTPSKAPEEPAAVNMPVEKAAETETRERGVTSIVSTAVSEHVARSFGDLAFAVDSSPRRSFDEIAEDMLRPMLQEWLDDNLPTLVERLVREEIERVARGPRR